MAPVLRTALLLGQLGSLLAMRVSVNATAKRRGPGVVVVAGGASEGDEGDTTSWSFRLYRRLVQNGDVNGDGRIKVCILGTEVESPFLPNYFRWLGATEAENVQVATRADANNPRVVGTVESADVIFIRGGDQNVYYRQWGGNTLLERHIRTVVETRGGAIGGTSAGAMSQSQYALAGGRDLVSMDVLTDAQTQMLDDRIGGTAIKTDFLGFVPNTLIDTHYTVRARLGRLIGVLARAIQDNRAPDIVGIGLEERTGLVIQGNTAEVIGVGSVDVIRQTPESVLRRDSRRPLFYTNLRVDRLTEGWRFNVRTGVVDTANVPRGTETVRFAGDSAPNSGSLTIQGTATADEDRFQRVIDAPPRRFRTAPASGSPFVRDAIGFVGAQDSRSRGQLHEALFRALYDLPSWSGFLVPESAQLFRSAGAPDEIQFERNSRSRNPEAATIVVDGRTITHRSLSPYFSNLDGGSRSLQAAGLVNMRVHVLAESDATATRGARYDTRRHQIVGGPRR